MSLRSLGDAYIEGFGIKNFGANWREKRAKALADVKHTEAETSQALALTEHTQAATATSKYALQEAQDKALRAHAAAKAQGYSDEEAMQAAAEAGKMALTSAQTGNVAATTAHTAAETAAIPAETALKKAQTGLAGAEADYYARRPGSTGTMKIVQNAAGESMAWDYANGPAPPGFYDATTARTRGKELRGLSTLDSLLKGTDSALKDYESHFKGLERLVPSAIDPSKMVSRQYYASKLGSLAQLFGRTALQDQRVSNQDRDVYANAMGLTSEYIMTLDPTAARQRLDDLRYMIQDYKAKYGSPEGNLAPGAEGSTSEVRPTDVVGARAGLSGAGPATNSHMCFTAAGQETPCR